MITIIFYIFSLIISITDYKSYLVPNKILILFLITLISTQLYYEQLHIINIILSIGIFTYFILMSYFIPKMRLGGGDIKYYSLVLLYLNIYEIPIFLIITGLIQSLLLIYNQKVLQKKYIAMVPLIFISVIITDIITILNINPLMR